MDFNVKFQSLDNDFDANFGIKREIATFSYGKELIADGQNVQLLDQNGNILSEIETQDTTYSVATEESDGLLSAADKIKLDNVEENVQADWNEEDTTSDAYIKNKPTIPATLNDLSGILPVEKGGTGADNSTAALTNLGAQASTDNALNTTSKTVVGAINELYSTIGTLNDSLEGVLNGQ